MSRRRPDLASPSPPSRAPGGTRLAVDRLLRMLTLVIVTGGAAAPAHGQAVTDGRLWTGVTVQGSFDADSRWVWSADSLLRGRDFADTLDAMGQRLIVSRRLGVRSTLGVGYQIARAFPAGRDAVTEHRVVQQVTWARPFGRIALSLRTRVEQRLIDGNDRAAVRLRGQVRAAMPAPIGRRASVVVADEVFVHANRSRLVDRGFDAHRLYAGVRQPVGRQASVDVGYYNVFSHGRSGVNRRSHVLSMLLGLSF